MPLSTKPYRGARDFYPEDNRLRKYIFSVWRSVVESFGYEEYDAPILEPMEIYAAKTGEEIVKDQTYSFKDRGDRQVVIRPEMTPTVSRMVAGKRQELAYPLRWYSIPNLWRYERPQNGRLREHWQLNVDIFGVESLNAETELINIVDAIFRKFGANETMYEIRLNNRKLTDAILKDYLKLPDKTADKVSKLIDRYHKMDKTKFVGALDDILSAKEKERGVSEKLMSLLASKNLKDLPDELTKLAATKELNQTFDSLKALGIKNTLYDPTLVRGFDYYTGIVFEVYDKNPDNNRSMMGGGRYDGLVGLFGVSPVPTAGFGWGDVTLENFLKGHHLLPNLPSETDLYAAIITKNKEGAYGLIASLRKAGLNVATDISGRKLAAQLKTANKKGVNSVVILGDDELKSGKITLKDMSSGKEIQLSTSDLIKRFKG
ncbi:MAG TPA: histidine--tRNA ligase [Candidatus Sulfotelmatobacter sp.]|nr:histidine--tRNA ligase [Candidatus Sulfotelmatobacter sp.]